MKTTPSQQLFDSNSETSKTSRCPLQLKSCCDHFRLYHKENYDTKKKKRKKERVCICFYKRLYCDSGMWSSEEWVPSPWSQSDGVQAAAAWGARLMHHQNTHTHTQAAQQQQSSRGKRTFLPVRLELIKTSGHIYTSKGAFLRLEEGRGILKVFSIFKVNLRTSWM